MHKGCPPCGCSPPRWPSEGLECSSCSHPCHAEGHTDLCLSPHNAAATLSTTNQSCQHRKQLPNQVLLLTGKTVPLPLHPWLHWCPRECKGFAFSHCQSPSPWWRQEYITDPALGGSKKHMKPLCTCCPSAGKGCCKLGLLCQSNSGEGKSHRGEKGGECWWVHGIQSLYIILQVGNKIWLRGHVPWVIYKYDVCTRSRMRFCFQQKQQLLLVICPTSRLRDCPSHIRESVKALKNILNHFWNPHSWGMVLPPTS